MVRIILGMFALACILMMLGWTFKSPETLLSGMLLWTAVAVWCWQILVNKFKRN